PRAALCPAGAYPPALHRSMRRFWPPRSGARRSGKSDEPPKCDIGPIEWISRKSPGCPARHRERSMNSITLFLTFVAVLIGLVLLAAAMPIAAAAFFVLAVLIFASLKMANAWERFVILRAGRLHGVKGPGLFLIVPILDSITTIVDQRIQTTAFSAEQALTRDTVPVNVEAVVFWHVHDAQKAALNITNYREAVDRVSQTSLREMIDASMLAALLSERQAADEFLRAEIARKTADWGVSVNSVEIRD